MLKTLMDILITFNSLLFSVPSETDGFQQWKIIEQWTQIDGRYRLVADGSSILAKCKDNPSFYLETPMVIHTLQEVYADEHLIAYHNDPKTGKIDTFATSLTLKCSQLNGFKKLYWVIYSTNSFFARFPHFPKVGAERPISAPRTRIIFAASSIAILLICLHSLLIFLGRLRRRFLTSYLLSGIFLATFTSLAVPSFWGIDLDFVFHYKLFTSFIVLSGITVLDLLAQSKLLTRSHFIFVLALLSISLLAILGSNNTEFIQASINLAYLVYCPTVLWVTIISFRKLLLNRSRLEFLNFLSIGCFSFSLAHDMLLVPGLINGVMLCPLGFVSFFFFQGVYLHKTVSSVYSERDSYRENLEKAYQEKIDLIQKNAVAHTIANTTQMIAHDLKKPFSMLKLIIKQINVATPQLDLVNRFAVHLQETTRYVDNLISDLLVSGNLTSNKLEPIDLEGVAKVAWEQQAFGRGRQFTLEFDITHSNEIFVDKIKITRLLANLFGNAMDAMPDGYERIWIKSKDISVNNRLYAEIVVGNKGSYIAPDKKERLFSKFYTDNKTHGTGLGLAICLEIVNSHGGKIWCNSEIQKGTEFVFTLPTVPPVITN